MFIRHKLQTIGEMEVKKVQENQVENLLEDQMRENDLICVKVDKVYDWIIKENSFDIFPTKEFKFDVDLTEKELKHVNLHCEIVPDERNPVEVLKRERCQFCIDGKNVWLENLTIRKNFTVTLCLVLPSGRMSEGKRFKTSRDELVTLCAPEGTNIEVTFTKLDCFVASKGSLSIHEGHHKEGPEHNPHPFVELKHPVISVSSCQSIQSTFPVTVELWADFCEPREDFIAGCSGPTHPPQCPTLFPSHGHCH